MTASKDEIKIGVPPIVIVFILLLVRVSIPPLLTLLIKASGYRTSTFS